MRYRSLVRFVRVDRVLLLRIPDRDRRGGDQKSAPATGAAARTRICVACVVGRYHYAVDVAAGAAVALLFWLVN
jgi:hypothetical protein